MHRLNDEYFEWLYALVCENRYSRSISYRELLRLLYDAEFVYTIRRDRNREQDGLCLRNRFVDDNGYEPHMTQYIEGPCSILEMMVALAIRCEETIMDEPLIGDRTGQWFWGMIKSLGLGDMYDTLFDREYVEDVIVRFLNREYEPDGRGGLFTVKNPHRDMRDIEIWNQMHDYINTIP